MTCLAILGLCGCLLPADIHERELAEEDGDLDFSYRPYIVNPQPATGRVMLLAGSPTQVFRIQFADAPHPDDVERLDSFEVRWYLNRASSPAPLRIVQGWPVDGFRELLIAPADLYRQLIEDYGPSAGETLAKEGYHYLEVFVSDLGFDPLSDSPDSLSAGASRAEAAWLIQFDTDTPVTN